MSKNFQSFILAVTSLPWLLLGPLALARSPLSEARTFYLIADNERAEKILNKWLSSDRADNSESLKPLGEMLLGMVQLRRNEFEKARSSFEKVLVQRQSVAPYAFYYLGEAYQKLGRHIDAHAAYGRVGYFHPPVELKTTIRLRMAEMALAEKKYSEAEKHFRYLEKKWRRSPQVVEVLWAHLGMLVAGHGDQRKKCDLAERLFVHFPHHPLVREWTGDLHSNLVSGVRLGCIASEGARTARIKRLQLSGESARARAEIDSWRASMRDPIKADLVLAQFMILDGFPNDALNLLRKYYGENERNISYLKVVARAAARAGEHLTAIGLYLRLHGLNPRGRVGREALYQAAFMSYLIEDYDGAQRRFTQFIEQFSSSALARDARWYCAWMNYLRGDFPAAEQSLGALKKRDDRIQYWLAMTYLRDGRIEDARRGFTELVQDRGWSYYGQVARVRLGSLPASKDNLVPTVEQRAPASLIPTEDSGQVIGERGPPGDDDDQADLSEASEDDNGALLAGDESDIESDDEDRSVSESLLDPRMRRRFEATKDLVAMGLFDWARQELYEVERRTRHVGHLKSLIPLYEEMGAHHRTVAITHSQLADLRLKLGVDKAKDLWQSAYPRAYEHYVNSAGNQFNVPKEIVWSIMHAESTFRPDVLSPVGARGLLQLMPETGRQVARLLGEEEAYNPILLINPETNIRYGTRYLARLLKRYQNVLPLVAGAYNAGPHRMDTWMGRFGDLEMDEFIEHVPYSETRNYMKKVSRNFVIYRRLYRGDNAPADFLTQSLASLPRHAPSARENWEGKD